MQPGREVKSIRLRTRWKAAGHLTENELGGEPGLLVSAGELLGGLGRPWGAVSGVKAGYTDS